MLRLAGDIGARDRVIFKRPTTVSYWNGNFYPLDSPLAALTFPGLSLFDKVPFGLSMIYLKLTSNWRPLEQTTAHAWASKWMGKGAYDLIWQPLLDHHAPTGRVRPVPDGRPYISICREAAVDEAAGAWRSEGRRTLPPKARQANRRETKARRK